MTKTKLKTASKSKSKPVSKKVKAILTKGDKTIAVPKRLIKPAKAVLPPPDLTPSMPVPSGPEMMPAHLIPNVADPSMARRCLPDIGAIPIIGSINGITLVHQSQVDFDAKRAKWVLELQEFRVMGAKIDRELSQPHVGYLFRTMVDQLFRPEIVDIVTCVCDEPIDTGFGVLPPGTPIRMNCQHVSWAYLRLVAKAELHPELNLARTYRFSMLQYRAKTLDDVRQLYSTLDRARARTVAIAFRARTAGTEQFKGVPERVRRILHTAFDIWRNEKRQGKAANGDEIGYLIQTDYADVTDNVVACLMDPEVLHSKKNDPYLKGALVAAMFATFAANAPEAFKFWRQVRQGVSFTDIYDPRKRLCEEVVKSQIAAAGGRNREDKYTTEELFRTAIHCWNYAMRGDSMKSMRLPNAREEVDTQFYLAPQPTKKLVKRSANT